MIAWHVANRDLIPGTAKKSREAGMMPEHKARNKH